MKFVQREIFFTMLGNYGVGSYSVVPPDRFSIQVSFVFKMLCPGKLFVER